MSDYVFDNAEDALKWAVEVLRRRRLPRTAGFWREIEAEAEWTAQVWEGGKNLRLPQGADERMELALAIMEGLVEVDADDAVVGKLVRLWAWGDWADEGRLRVALAMQEKLRREGVRVRMSYRYSYAQLGALLGCDKKVAWRKVQEGLGLLNDKLVGKGIVGMDMMPEQVADNFKKMVYSSDFKINNE